MNRSFKAGAIYIALVIMLLSTTVTFAFLLLTQNYHYELIKLIDFQEQLYDLESGLNLLLEDEQIPTGKFQTVDLYEASKNRKVELLKTNWGIFERYSVCVGQEGKICQHYLIGQNYDDFPALYVQDRRNVFTIDHRSSIKGSAFLPNGRYEIYYTSDKGKQSSNIKPNVYKSDADLLAINIADPGNSTMQKYTDYQYGDTIKNSFDNAPLLIRENKLERLSLTGNIIVQGNSLLLINQSSKLEDIIVMADSVIISSGFEGSLQVFAKKYIEVESRAKLMYPSALILHKSAKGASINIRSDSYLFGACISSNAQSNIKISERVSIGGLIYSAGQVELHSDLYGSLICNQTWFQNRSGTFENYLMEIDLLQTDMDRHFFYPTVVATQNVQKDVIKKLQ